jgi:hypothetical protein
MAGIRQNALVKAKMSYKETINSNAKTAMLK